MYSLIIKKDKICGPYRKQLTPKSPPEYLLKCSTDDNIKSAWEGLLSRFKRFPSFSPQQYSIPFTYH